MSPFVVSSLISFFFYLNINFSSAECEGCRDGGLNNDNCFHLQAPQIYACKGSWEDAGLLYSTEARAICADGYEICPSVARVIELGLDQQECGNINEKNVFFATLESGTGAPGCLSDGEGNTGVNDIWGCADPEVEATGQDVGVYCAAGCRGGSYANCDNVLNAYISQDDFNFGHWAGSNWAFQGGGTETELQTARLSSSNSGGVMCCSLPTPAPTKDPTFDPTRDPTSDPTNDPTLDPTKDPTNEPTIEPTSDPTSDPTKDPTVDPTKDPTEEPTTDPTTEPTNDPTDDPTQDPTVYPTVDPTKDPTHDPTTDPTNVPTSTPTTPSPTDPGTIQCGDQLHGDYNDVPLIIEVEMRIFDGDMTFDATQSNFEIANITAMDKETNASLGFDEDDDNIVTLINVARFQPVLFKIEGIEAAIGSFNVTIVCNSDAPTKVPTTDPTSDPTKDPTIEPTRDPTVEPTFMPTANPTNDPTIDPTANPTQDPSSDPTSDPTSYPTQDPTQDPTVYPTVDPSMDSTIDPTRDPTIEPTFDPTTHPSVIPSSSPTQAPSAFPTVSNGNVRYNFTLIVSGGTPDDLLTSNISSFVNDSLKETFKEYDASYRIVVTSDGNELTVSVITSTLDTDLTKDIEAVVNSDEFDQDLEDNIDNFNEAEGTSYDVVINIGSNNDGSAKQFRIELWQVIVGVVVLVAVVVIITVIIVCYCQRKKGAEKDTSIINADQGEVEMEIPQQPGLNTDVKNTTQEIVVVNPNESNSEDRTGSAEGTDLDNISGVEMVHTPSEQLYDNDNDQQKETAGEEKAEAVIRMDETNGSSEEEDSFDEMYNSDYRAMTKGHLGKSMNNNRVHLPESSADLGGV